MDATQAQPDKHVQQKFWKDDLKTKKQKKKTTDFWFFKKKNNNQKTWKKKNIEKT